jgi:hypothetical protein
MHLGDSFSLYVGGACTGIRDGFGTLFSCQLLTQFGFSLPLRLRFTPGRVRCVARNSATSVDLCGSHDRSFPVFMGGVGIEPVSTGSM